ncbi:MAG TPA: pyrimidine 5'-nucleotidase [Aliidongia sp.]|nr:pyrimidine 5'-nucleotidase [Aliidongia sp.]
MPLIRNEIQTWIFDLDNTLYPASSDLFPQISARMGQFIGRRFDLDPEAARALQKQLFRRHGTTLRGLMVEHGVDPHEFMDYVHDIDLAALAPALALDAALAALPGRKLIHTNGSVAHAERVLAWLGLAAHFEGVFDIVAAEFVPKPEPAGYAALLRRYGIEPARAAMVEDMAVNLKPAAELGMLTLWVRTANDWAVEGSVESWVHHHTEDLAGWLAAPAG